MAERRQPRMGRIAAVAALALLVIATVILWSEREPIVRHYVDRELARRGVQARYTIAHLGPMAQRLDNLVIGDPAHPDLTAKTAELHLGWGITGPYVSGIEARGVRLNGRLIEGRLSLGEIDKLLPKPSGKPFALPDVDLDIGDARMRLLTPAGPVALSLEGKGRLSGGFAGTLAAVASNLAADGCRVMGANAFLSVSVTNREPAVEGPVRAASVSCLDRGLVADAMAVTIKAHLGETLATWRGAAGFVVGKLRYRDNRIAVLRGKADFAGDAKETQGKLSFTSQETRFALASAEQAAFDGGYGISGGDVLGLRGDLMLDGASLDRAAVKPVRAMLAPAMGTPIGPLGAALADAIERATRRADVKASLDMQQRPEGGRLTLTTLDLTSASGAHARIGKGQGVTYGWGKAAGLRVDGEATLAGGGFPDMRAILRQPVAGSPLAGNVTVAPYAVRNARLVFAPIHFSADPDGTTRVATTATIDGPLGEGRIEGLSLPIAGRFGRGGAFVLGEGCVPLRFARLAVAGTRIGPSRLPLCPIAGEALLARRAGGSLSGGAKLTSPKLVGHVGDTPLTLAARSIVMEAGHPGFVVDALSVRLGAGEATTRLDVPHLDGVIDKQGLGGRFQGAAGQIVNVPLRLSDANGMWRLADGTLTLTGGLAVDDAAPDPRFNRLLSNDVRLTLHNGAIQATGTLVEPESHRAIADVRIVHALSAGKGEATLVVPGLTFGNALQPEKLTRLTLGVIANVAGTVKGEGHIVWGPHGVRSNGDFETASLDLAAAFGPVTGLKGHVHFTDLLGLETAPGQEMTLGEVNPGVAVQNGTIHYQLLAGQRVRIESGHWPFSGGTLTLEPTELDFGHPVERHLTFRVDGLDAALFIEQFKLDNIAATGTFDGVLPMIFDQAGGRIVDGRLIVRRGGGTLAYVGEVSNADLGMFGKLAFDALKAIRYDSLLIELNGALDGEIVSRIVFTGINDQPKEGQPSTGLLKDLTGLPFKFNIVVRAPFRGLMHTATTFADPTSLLHEQEAQPPVQPQESGDMREKP